jgi:hypothetical protein
VRAYDDTHTSGQHSGIHRISYNDVKSLALELADATSKNATLREAAHHFLSEMLNAIRSSGDGSGVVHAMNTSILPDDATQFRSTLVSSHDNVSSSNQSDLAYKPVPARPQTGGKRKMSRIKSSLENPVKGGGLKKSCTFCRQEKHTISLSNYEEIWYPLVGGELSPSRQDSE